MTTTQRIGAAGELLAKYRLERRVGDLFGVTAAVPADAVGIVEVG